jgi:hypothetical protein
MSSSDLAVVAAVVVLGVAGWVNANAYPRYAEWAESRADVAARARNAALPYPTRYEVAKTVAAAGLPQHIGVVRNRDHPHYGSYVFVPRRSKDPVFFRTRRFPLDENDDNGYFDDSGDDDFEPRVDLACRTIHGQSHGLFPLCRANRVWMYLSATDKNVTESSREFTAAGAREYTRTLTIASTPLRRAMLGEAPGDLAFSAMFYTDALGNREPRDVAPTDWARLVGDYLDCRTPLESLVAVAGRIKHPDDEEKRVQAGG